MYQHILVPLDGSEPAECVLPHVVAIAGGCNVVRVTLARVVSPFHLHDYAEERLPARERHELEAKATEHAREYLEGIKAGLKKKRISTEIEILTGEPVERLVSWAHNNGVDLIIVSTHGRSDISQLVSKSVAENLLRTAEIPILMVHTPKH
ncbi:universal stress protein [Chloroflexota bacterium]